MQTIWQAVAVLLCLVAVAVAWAWTIPPRYKKIIILWAGLGIIILMCLYPPWLRTHNRFVADGHLAVKLAKVPLPSRYAFLLTPPEEQEPNITASIDIRRLLVQCVIVLLVGGGLAFLYRSKDKKSQ
jgi:hypothetical protein